MFSRWDICTDILVNVTLSAVSLKDHTVQEPCDTWQRLLKDTLLIQNTEGGLADVVSASNDYTAIPPLQKSLQWEIGAADAILLLFVYSTVFVVASNSIKGLA